MRATKAMRAAATMGATRVMLHHISGHLSVIFWPHSLGNPSACTHYRPNSVILTARMTMRTMTVRP